MGPTVTDYSSDEDDKFSIDSDDSQLSYDDDGKACNKQLEGIESDDSETSNLEGITLVV